MHQFIDRSSIIPGACCWLTCLLTTGDWKLVEKHLLAILKLVEKHLLAILSADKVYW